MGWTVSPQNLYVGVLTLVPQKVSVISSRVFQEVMKEK